MARPSSRGGSVRSRFQLDEGRPETDASFDGFRPLATSLALTDKKWAKNELLVILRSEAENGMPSSAVFRCIACAAALTPPLPPLPPPFARGGKSATSGLFFPLAKGGHRGVLRVPLRCARLGVQAIENRSRIWLYPFPEHVMTHTCKSSSARHREQEQGADFVPVGCLHPSILRHFQFFPIQSMISTGSPASPVVPSWHVRNIRWFSPHKPSP